MPSRWGSCLLLALLLLQSCAGLQKVLFEQPEASLKDVKIKKIASSELELTVVLDIYNPNSYELSLLALNYQIQALDMVLGEGAFSETFAIPAKERRTVSLPLKVKARPALQVARHFLTGKGDVMAIMLGDIKFKTPIGPWNLDFEDKKKISNPLSL